MKRYAVIDTNVLVSAMLKWTSVPGNIMEFAFSGVIIRYSFERKMTKSIVCETNR